MFLTCAAAVAAALEPAGRQEGPGAPVRQLAYLKASNSDAFDHFACGGSLPGHIGNALAVSGDGNTIAVGAPHESSAARGINGNQDDNSLYNSGAVYVYVRRGDAWTQQAYLKASNAGQSDQFGLSLSLSRDGNTLAVAAPWEASAATGVNGNQQDDSIPQAGAVYVFTRAGNTWSQHSYIKASNTGRKGVDDDIEGDQFGFSISVSGDGSTLAVGAVGEDSNATGINGVQTDDSASGSGAVYVFTKTAQHVGAAGLSQEQQQRGGRPVRIRRRPERRRQRAGGGGVRRGWFRQGRESARMTTAGTAPARSMRSTAAAVRGGRPATSRARGRSATTRLATPSRSAATATPSPAGTAEESCLNGGINPSGCDVDTFPSDLAAGSVGAVVHLGAQRRRRWVEQAFIKASNPDLEDWFAVRLALNGDGSRVFVGAPMEDSAATGVNGRAG